jgi:hypothetical protein
MNGTFHKQYPLTIMRNDFIEAGNHLIRVFRVRRNSRTFAAGNFKKTIDNCETGKKIDDLDAADSCGWNRSG